MYGLHFTLYSFTAGSLAAITTNKPDHNLYIIFVLFCLDRSGIGVTKRYIPGVLYPGNDGCDYSLWL